MYFFIFFFFQAEDGIRDYKVTGVQTCALPIFFPRGDCIITNISTSLSLWRRQCGHRYAIRAGRNLPDKEFRYLRTVIVTAAVYWEDRKSTRLNSSHLVISYAVFCLKKKNRHEILL